jgi:hypothetical protein
MSNLSMGHISKQIIFLVSLQKCYKFAGNIISRASIICRDGLFSS